MEASSYDEVVSQLNTIKDSENFQWVYNNKVHYLNIPCSFDIETSSFKEGIAKKAIMYIWMLDINGTIFIGRTWEKFVELLQIVSDVFDLHKYNHRLLIYVHNLEYEFQFMRKWIQWYDVFADKKRSPLYAVTQTGIEFRCSYRLSGYSLANLAKELTKYKAQKMVGDLDYNLIRHSETPLTEKEIGYCVNDVIVVVCYIQEEIEREGNIAKIPYTKTGYVRRYCMQKCVNINDKDDVSRLKKLKYKDLIKSLTLTYDQYLLCKRGFQGGFTHANINYVNQTIENVGSIDFTSSYPYTMVAQYFPMTSPMEKKVSDWATFKVCLQSYCCLFEITFKNISIKDYNETPISYSRCTNVKGETLNNGRIIRADILTTVITELDFDIIQMYYQWDEIYLGKFLIFYKGYLPTLFVKSIIDLYKAKTTLKGVEGKEDEYLLSKGMLNSAYGMSVTDIIRDSLDYHQDISADGWAVEQDTEFSQLNRYNTSQTRFLYYPWGVWVTAHARHNLFKGIHEFGDDYIYSDTDSIKAKNMDKHQEFIKTYNQHVRESLQMAADYHQIPMEDFEPETINGEKKLIGVWDYEGTYDKFKTLGAKRYLVQKGNDITFTVAGVRKDSIKQYMLSTYGLENVFDKFTRNLKIPKDQTGKLTHTYIDSELEGDIIDYLNQPYHYHEKSCINLEPAEFSLSMLDAFWNFVKGVKQVEA